MGMNDKMGSHELITLQAIFTQCFKDIAVFERFSSDGHYFESNDLIKEAKRWLVIAAGINEDDAKKYFNSHPNRFRKAIIPLSYKSLAKISLLFVIKPLSINSKHASSEELVAPFAPNRGIDLIEIRQGFIKVNDIPDNSQNLKSIRIDWELLPSLQEPFEKWLCSWKRECGFNPAHPPSHLHLNPKSSLGGNRPGDLVDDLRLYLGKPNPLALILSIANWLRKLRY